MSTRSDFAVSMPPKKRHKEDKRVFETKELLLLEFSLHDLKYRTCSGKHKQHTYYRCSRCPLRVATKRVDLGIECSMSECKSLCLSVSLCAVCQASECVYVSLPCMHRCTCAGCACKCKICPICRIKVSSWKKVFEAGIAGTAEDLDASVPAGPMPAVVLPIVAAVPQVRVDIDPSSSDDADVFDSSSSVEYNPQHRERTDSLPPPTTPRPHRQQQVMDSEWILRTTFCRRWSEAALIARCGNRSHALSLLESFHWKLRTCAFDRILIEIIDMGFNEMPARVCLLSNNGEKVHALEELLRSGVYVGVNGIVYEKNT
jgi:hypothetical protein